MKITRGMNLVYLGLAIIVVMISIFLFLGRGSPEEVTNQFMTALAKGDVDKLVDLTYDRGGDKAELRKEWEFATHDAGKYYAFRWRVISEAQSSDTEANVELGVFRNALNRGAYEERFGVALLKQNGKWKVDVLALNRQMYPALPRVS